MIGDAILICPKIRYFNQIPNDIYLVHQTLPKDSKWYDYSTKVVYEGDSIETEVILSDYQQAVFVKAASIIPIKLHDHAQSLTLAYDKPIRLEIYLDDNGYAIGSVYFDDGVTFNYKTS